MLSRFSYKPNRNWRFVGIWFVNDLQADPSHPININIKTAVNWGHIQSTQKPNYHLCFIFLLFFLFVLLFQSHMLLFSHLIAWGGTLTDLSSLRQPRLPRRGLSRVSVPWSFVGAPQTNLAGYRRALQGAPLGACNVLVWCHVTHFHINM